MVLAPSQASATECNSSQLAQLGRDSATRRYTGSSRRAVLAPPAVWRARQRHRIPIRKRVRQQHRKWPQMARIAAQRVGPASRFARQTIDLKVRNDLSVERGQVEVIAWRVMAQSTKG